MWPPSLGDLKADLGTQVDDRDAQLQVVLTAAVSFVERVRAGEFNFAGEILSELPDPPDDLSLGAIRLAGRWDSRRDSPEMVIPSAEFGATRIPSVDPDIERLLGIGRYRGPVWA